MAYCCTTTKIHWSTSFNTPVYRCNLDNTTEGEKSTILGVKSMHQFRKRGKIGLNQSLKYIYIYIYPFPPLSPTFYFSPLFNSVAERIS
jgi:hypothetical protein